MAAAGLHKQMGLTYFPVRCGDRKRENRQIKIRQDTIYYSYNQQQLLLCSVAHQDITRHYPICTTLYREEATFSLSWGLHFGLVPPIVANAKLINSSHNRAITVVA